MGLAPTQLSTAPLAYFADKIAELDAHEGQQTWKALVILIALRYLRHLWWQSRIRLAVCADNIAALTLLCRLKASGRGPSIIAREIALEFCDSPYAPYVVTHTPGVANVIADTLSRRYDPSKAFSLLLFLDTVGECFPPPRDPSYYEALSLLADDT